MLIKYDTVSPKHDILKKLYNEFKSTVVHDDLLNVNPWKIDDYEFHQKKLEYKHLAVPFLLYVIWIVVFLIPAFIFELFFKKIQRSINKIFQKVRYFF